MNTQISIEFLKETMENADFRSEVITNAYNFWHWDSKKENGVKDHYCSIRFYWCCDDVWYICRRDSCLTDESLPPMVQVGIDNTKFKNGKLDSLLQHPVKGKSRSVQMIFDLSDDDFVDLASRYYVLDPIHDVTKQVAEEDLTWQPWNNTVDAPDWYKFNIT